MRMASQLPQPPNLPLARFTAGPCGRAWQVLPNRPFGRWREIQLNEATNEDTYSRVRVGWNGRLTLN